MNFYEVCFKSQNEKEKCIEVTFENSQSFFLYQFIDTQYKNSYYWQRLLMKNFTPTTI